MKVRVSLTVDIDPDEWAARFGEPRNRQAALREDVQWRVREAVVQALPLEGTPTLNARSETRWSLKN